MTKNYYTKMTLKLIRELSMYKNALEYYDDFTADTPLPASKRKALADRRGTLERRVRALENALTLLNDTERTIIEHMYVIDSKSADDMCEILAFERSSIYRHRARALEKLSLSLFGRT